MIDFKDKKIMVVVAHPDDELLGCGATMHKLTSEFNCEIRAVILGEGLTSRSDSRDTDLWREQLAIHKANIEAARQSIGYTSTGVYDFPDNRFDTVALLDIIKVVEKEKQSFDPVIIFTHHGGDVNIDHQRTFEAVITATRPLKDETVKTIITFNTPSGTEWQPSNHPMLFTPNFYMEVSKKNLDAKIKGMESYEFERREYPHPRSKEALINLSQQTGIVVGKSYAESFYIVRTIE